MNYYRIAFVLLIAAGLGASLACPAKAILITNTTTDTVLFEDDFEGVSAYDGTWTDAVAIGNVAENDYDPIALTGSYIMGEAQTYDTQVCNSSTLPDPGAFEGNNYLRMGRSGGFAPNYLNFTAPQNTAGDVLHFESMITESVVTEGDLRRTGLLSFYSGNTNVLYFLLDHGVLQNYVGSYSNIYYTDSFEYTSDPEDPSGATLLAMEDASTWYKVEVDYALAEETYSLTVNDVTVSGIPVNSASSAVDRARLSAGSANEGLVYYDHCVEGWVPPQDDIPGDANGDGQVDGSDVTILAGNWQAGVGDPNTDTITWEMGDFNGDGQIDGSDVTILAGNWQYGVEAAASAVPEPSSIVLMLSAIAGLLCWRRTK